MIRHLLRLVWNRKRANALVMVEILLSFLVLFVVLTLVALHADRWRMPLGFEPSADVLYVQLTTDAGSEWVAAQGATAVRVREELARLDEVVAVGAATALPYDGNSHNVGSRVDGRDVMIAMIVATPGLGEALGVRLSGGRWFDGDDAKLERDTFVIDRRYGRILFGDLDPVGRPLPAGAPGVGDRPATVVGVVETFRKHGELSEPGPFAFRLERGADEQPLTNMAVRVVPGTPAAFEGRLATLVADVAPGWDVRIRSMDRERDRVLRFGLAPLVAGGIVAAFLLAMVALGLVGVLWQSVARRTGEIGLRRALGADRRSVMGQILLELALTTGLAVAVGALIAVQLPLLRVWDALTPGRFAAGLVGAAATILVLALGCGLYPALLATRIEPAAALHDD